MGWLYIIAGLMIATIIASRWAHMPWHKALFVMVLVPPVLFGSVACLMAGVLLLLFLLNAVLQRLGIDVEEFLPGIGALIAGGVVLWLGWLFFSDERQQNLKKQSQEPKDHKHNQSIHPTSYLGG